VAKREKHHLNFKKVQRQILNVAWNDGIFDERTVSLSSDFHDEITTQVLHRGVPMAYTLGEIDRELLQERMEEGDVDED
jgi:hypothetical protein